MAASSSGGRGGRGTLAWWVGRGEVCSWLQSLTGAAQVSLGHGGQTHKRPLVQDVSSALENGPGLSRKCTSQMGVLSYGKQAHGQRPRGLCRKGLRSQREEAPTGQQQNHERVSKKLPAMDQHT